MNENFSRAEAGFRHSSSRGSADFNGNIIDYFLFTFDSNFISFLSFRVISEALLQSRPLPHVPKGTLAPTVDMLCQPETSDHSGTLLSQGSNSSNPPSSFETANRWTSKENLLTPAPEDDDPQLFVALYDCESLFMTKLL